MSEIVAEKTGLGFVEDFLTARDENDSFVLVEFGHAENPIAFSQPRPFLGDRAAIEIEAGLKDKYGKRQEGALERREDDPLEQNVFFIEHDLGGEITYQKLGTVSLYSGAYDAKTILPDAVADETFAGNVFGDEHQAEHRDRTAKLLFEMARLTVAGGYVVIRETYTPMYNGFLSEDLFESAGLEVAAKITQEDVEAWERLEAVYDADLAHNGPTRDSFYLILEKS